MTGCPRCGKAIGYLGQPHRMYPGGDACPAPTERPRQ